MSFSIYLWLIVKVDGFSILFRKDELAIDDAYICLVSANTFHLKMFVFNGFSPRTLRVCEFMCIRVYLRVTCFSEITRVVRASIGSGTVNIIGNVNGVCASVCVFVWVKFCLSLIMNAWMESGASLFICVEFHSFTWRGHSGIFLLVNFQIRYDWLCTEFNANILVHAQYAYSTIPYIMREQQHAIITQALMTVQTGKIGWYWSS